MTFLMSVRSETVAHLFVFAGILGFALFPGPAGGGLVLMSALSGPVRYKTAPDRLPLR